MKLKGKKELIIVIPGPKFMEGLSKPIRKSIIYLYGLTNVLHPVYYNYGKKYAQDFSYKDKQGIWLHWERGVNPLSRWLAVKRLRKIIKEYSNNYKISIVGISLGGEIALEALNKIEDGKVRKLVLVCPVIENPVIKAKKTKVVSIYSNHDYFAKLSAKILSPIIGDIKGRGIFNIEIPSFSHDNFCNNDKIKYGKYKGKRIGEVIISYLR